MSSMDLYLCRHGRTPLNAAGRLRGRLDPDLDWSASPKPATWPSCSAPAADARVSSPLGRARQTATPIAVAGGLGVEFDGRLVDRSYGQFDGALREDLIAEYGSINAAPGLEPEAEVAARGVAALTELAQAGTSGPVVVVTHARCCGTPSARWCRATPPTSCCRRGPVRGRCCATPTAPGSSSKPTARTTRSRLRWLSTEPPRHTSGPGR